MTRAFRALSQTILCIDDDEAILRYEKALLETVGFAVLKAASAEQGLRLVTMCECDAVLLDYDMPGMNGHEVALQIKRMRPDLIVIFVSSEEIPMHSLALVDAFVPKLEASRQLLPMIAELCSRSQDAQQKRGELRRQHRSTIDSPSRQMSTQDEEQELR
jgi:DNA-binding response OmpR family regulator